MKNYAVIQHNYSEFLGLIEGQLEKRDIGFSYVRPFVGQDMPGSAIQFDALFLLGASWPVGDSEHMPWLADELRLIASFEKAKRPVVGLGFGALLLAQYAGGQPSDQPFHNAYWTTAHIAPGAEQDPIAQAVAGRKVLVMANGSVALPEGVLPLLVDDQGRWIAIRPSEHLVGLLFRPELKPGMIEDMIMEAGRKTPDNIADLLQTAREQWQDSQHTTDRLIVALVSVLDLMKERRKPPVFHLKQE
ncbi:MAG: GMP synthase [Gammaproteobacteria bacterium]|nr:GMP synthase [Gammaproteobacteria bacterium]